MSFGGAGGLHATAVAEAVGMGVVVYPRNPSTFSAHGILMSDIVHDLARTKLLELDDEAGGALAPLAADLLHEGKQRLISDGVSEVDRQFVFSADLRYRGQAFELILDVEDAAFPVSEIQRLSARFHAAHAQRFSFNDLEERIECVTLRLAAIGRLGSAEEEWKVDEGIPIVRRQRSVVIDGAWQKIFVHDFANVRSSGPLYGPLILQEPFTSVFITAGWEVHERPTGHLISRWMGSDE
jgi:N-methylhydantoinase A